MDRERLRQLVGDGLTLREIAGAVGARPRTVSAWLREFGLSPPGGRGGAARAERSARYCSHHGHTTFARRSEGGWRCLKCRSESVSRRRKRIKELLVSEAGGACALCGYSRCLGALEFHHLDPSLKLYSVAARGVTRALSDAREEARKCALLCANCHAEVEAGLSVVPPNAALG